MVRTQVYLTKKQRRELSLLSETTGKKQSELIREAIDRLIHEESSAHRRAVIRRAAGIWKDRTDLPDFQTLRADWDRA